MESGLSSGHGEAVSATVAVDTASLAGWFSGDERVGCRRVVSLIFAGWLPQDGLFGLSGSAGLKIERAHLSSRVGLCS
jgi:hypothetical protein